MVRLATQDDLDFAEQHDPLLTREALAQKIGVRQVYVAEEDRQLVGLLRYNFFCDLDPFLTLIWVLEAYRRKGIGTQLMTHWERQMRKEGHRFLLTSTQVDEEAQFFYRELGYQDAGSILFPGQVASELVLLKKLRESGECVGPRQKQ